MTENVQKEASMEDEKPKPIGYLKATINSDNRANIVILQQEQRVAAIQAAKEESVEGLITNPV